METSQTQSIGKKIKARAPPPPIQSASKPRMEHMSSSESEGTGKQNSEESKENVLHRKVDLTIFLPDGDEKPVTVDGSKAVMDLLVDLCSQQHLNPAQHTLEVRSGVLQQPLTLRPNTLIGTLDVETIFLKEKVTEVKVRKPAPKIPEKTVRLVVNFLGTQKAVVRVNPAVPLWNILPAVCEKCELNYENVTLLRDIISKEELDMSRSLNELGVKELYAWSSKQEKNRKLSSNSDTTEKEKRGIFGFFRSYKKGNKNEGSIGNVDSDDNEEVFRTATTSGNICEGFSTAPSSPSVNTRPIALGASLSLGNISGIDVRPEVKKRRAPPPPKPATPIVSVEKALENVSTDQMYATVQKEQKKKRRAPPPPISQMPNENEKHDDLEKRKSSTGNGRQVPQKPPRGNSRSPPQLMIPPPPPYPPPDNDIADQPVLENGAALTGPTRPIPAKREKRLIRCHSISSEEVLTTDDARSVNSYTEDSGIVSSPSDSVSLDLQNSSSTRRDKTENQVEEYKSSIGNVWPARSESINSEDSWSLHTSSVRAEDDVAQVQNGDEEHFIAAQFQKTLAELDEDSEDMDDADIGESNNIGSRSSPVGEEANHHYESNEPAAVPVTVIDEIPEINTSKYNPHYIAPVKENIKIQQSSINNNNSHGSGLHPERDKAEMENSIIYKIHQSFSQEGKAKLENIKDPEVQSTSDNPVNISRFNTSQKQYIVNENQSSSIVIPAASNKQLQETRPTKERTDSIPEPIEMKYSALNNAKAAEPSTKPIMWRQHTYEPKVGMTTFTVVPPKPDIKKYDREVSLSASAIKIDDLGNLISPQSSFDKKDVKDTLINENEGPLVEKPLLKRAKEFWRSNSMESQVVESKDQAVKKLVPVKSHKPNQAHEKTALLLQEWDRNQLLPGKSLNSTDNQMLPVRLDPKSATPLEKMVIIENTSKGRAEVSFPKSTIQNKFTGMQQATALNDPIKNVTVIESIVMGKTDKRTAYNERPNVSQQTRPVQLSTASQEKVIIIEQTNKDRKDLHFLKPSKRTSSQYVASAISKYTEPINNKSMQTLEAKPDINSNNGNIILKNNGKFTAEEPKVEVKTMNKQEISVDMRKNLSNNNGQVTNRNLQTEPTSKQNSNCEQLISAKIEKSLSEQNGFNGSLNILGNTTVTKRTNLTSVSSKSSYASQPISGLPPNAFLKAVREKSVKIEQANSVAPIKSLPAYVANSENEEKHNIDIIPSTIIDEPDSPNNSNIFGPKTKFRPVVQKPTQKDTSLHSALMGAIQSGEGKERLRKIQSSPTDGGDRKFSEPENERSALLSAIRAHDGISRLKKVPSAASDEVQTLRSTEMLQKDNEIVTTKITIPFPPPPPPPPVQYAAAKLPTVCSNSPVDAREALMEAIRSGAGASRLKKVSASKHIL
ncbi:protein cordon-bleu isoform X2 [Engystomops pustulosus]|uniref:protein cordon-bleu isoform X2 n=1 Tax=Engystomops pustulosus TaxID=76066 RepID=UPI003AFA94AE